MLQALVEFEDPEEFQHCKPSNIQIGETTELPELISEQSYLLFKYFNTSRADIKEWLNSLRTIDALNQLQLQKFIVWVKTYLLLMMLQKGTLSLEIVEKFVFSV